MKTCVQIIAIVTGVLAQVDELSLPPSTGPFNVGLKSYAFPKVTPNDPVAPNGTGTSILVEIYYPTTQNESVSEYIWDGLSDIYEKYYNIPFDAFGRATASVSQDAAALALEQWRTLNKPTLIFDPPFAGPPSHMFFALLSDLASHGYTIITIDHPYEQPFLQYPNGTGYKGLAMDFSPPDDEAIAFITSVNTYRLTDTSAVLDSLPSLSETLEIPINTTHIAFFGHSIGGSAALSHVLVERNRTDNTTCKPDYLGAIDIDGSIWSPANDSDADLKVPSLIFASEQDDDPTFDAFLPRQSAWAKGIRVLGHSNHTDFSDIVVLKQGNGMAGGEGALSAVRMVEIVRRVVGDFFEFVGGGEKEEGMLSGNEEDQREWPELEWFYNDTAGIEG